MSDTDLIRAYSFVQFMDRSDPVVDELCSYLEALMRELAHERTINRLIEDQLQSMGITLDTEVGSETNPEE